MVRPQGSPQHFGCCGLEKWGILGGMETVANSSADCRQESADRRQKSRITNGSALLPGIDGRSTWVRRIKDLLAAHIADLGGEDNVSEAEYALVRRVVTLIVELERREATFAQAGSVDDDALAIYQTTVNTLRRTLETLGLQRRARDVTLPSLREYLAKPQEEAAE